MAMSDGSDPGIWAMVSFLVAGGAALIAVGIVYFVMSGHLRAPFGEQPESLLDRFGVACFRVANRVVISAFGGAMLIGLYRVLTNRPKRRKVQRV
jgi:hypothetical protein